MEIYDITNLAENPENARMALLVFSKKNPEKEYTPLWVKKRFLLLDSEALEKFLFYSLQHLLIFRYRNGAMEMLFARSMISKEAVKRYEEKLGENEVYIAEKKEDKYVFKKTDWTSIGITEFPEITDEEINSFKLEMAKRELEAEKKKIEEKWGVSLNV